MADRRRQLGTLAVVALVLLRLAIGWHFYRQGTEKLAYDADRGYHVAFSAEGFLSQATGPLADLYRSQVSNVHDWPEHLAVPRQNEPASADELAEQAAWLAEYESRRKAAAGGGETVPVEFPPWAPYHGWATAISEDWDSRHESVVDAADLGDEQQAAAQQAFQDRKQQLADYLANELEAIADYQHELWRLDQWQNRPEADGVPFQEQRIAAKQAQTRQMPLAWVGQVRAFETDYRSDLRQIARSAQGDHAAVDQALADPIQSRLEQVNLAVTILTIGVGACLLLGLLTRLAALAGALFLAAVIASQPPWVPGATETIYQTVELAGLLVLAGTGAGRWFGLDFFTDAWWSRQRDDA